MLFGFNEKVNAFRHSHCTIAPNIMLQRKVKFRGSAGIGIRCCRKALNLFLIAASGTTFSHPNILFSILLITHCCICSYLLSISLATCWLNMEGEKDHTNGKKKISIVVGPWGGNGGTSWDDGSYDGVGEITLVYDWCIDSIHVVYDKNGKPVSAAKHGGNGGNKTAEIKLQSPDEFLVSASGHYFPVIHGGSSVIRSLSFKSNRRTFGPYGVEVGTPFSLSADGGGRIVGFKGRSGWYIDEIGFYLSRPQKSSGLYHRVQQKLKRLASTASLASKYSQA